MDEPHAVSRYHLSTLQEPIHSRQHQQPKVCPGRHSSTELALAASQQGCRWDQLIGPTDNKCVPFWGGFISVRSLSWFSSWGSHMTSRVHRRDSSYESSMFLVLAWNNHKTTLNQHVNSLIFTFQQANNQSHHKDPETAANVAFADAFAVDTLWSCRTIFFPLDAGQLQFPVSFCMISASLS